MKRNQVNAILINQAKRRTTIFAFICVIFMSTILSILLFLTYSKQNQNYYVNYKENSKIDYNVFLKENDFFKDKYLGSGKQYIASLIDYITAEFKYNVSLEEKNVDYKYSYRVEANINVKHKGMNTYLYNKDITLLEEKKSFSSQNNVEIDEKIDIDYNYYNDLIQKFISIYNLEDIESNLIVNMYINVIGSCEEFEKSSEKESVMSLSIPLTTKTMAIDISDNLINNDNNVMLCKKANNNIAPLIFGVIFLILDMILIILTIRYEIKTRTAENIYERELKKILNNYSSYIQTMNSDFEFKDYQLLKIDTFTDMLEIRDTIRQPILMKENNDKTGAYFVIPSNSKILYVYRLKVSDIERKINKKLK